MTTIHNIASETEALLIDQMARDIRHDTDLGEEWRVIADLKNADWAASIIFDYLDRVIERKRVLKVREAMGSVACAAIWAPIIYAGFVGASILDSRAALAAEAHTISDAIDSMSRWTVGGVAVFGWVAMLFILVGVASLIRLMKRPQPDDTWNPPAPPSDIERRRRNAEGE